MPVPSTWTRSLPPQEPGLGFSGLNRVIEALAHAERLNAQLPITITPPSLVAPRTITIEDQPGTLPAATTMTVRLTGFEAGKYSWTEVYLDQATGEFLDLTGGKVGTFESDWAIEINGLTDCWSSTPGVKSFARIVPSEGFGFYRFYQVKTGAAEDPCTSRSLTSRVLWADTGARCDKVSSHVVTKQSTGAIVPTTASPFFPGEYTADLSPESLGPGTYTIQVQVDNNGRICALESEVTIALGDCDVTVDTPVCCPRAQITTQGCPGGGDGQGDGLVEFDKFDATTTVPIGGAAYVDPVLSAPYPSGTVTATLTPNAPFDSTPIETVADFSCGGSVGPFGSSGMMMFSMGTAQPDASHVCGCPAPPYPRTLYYSDSDGNSAVLTWFELCGVWMGTYTVTGTYVHTTSPGIEKQCVESTGSSTTVLVTLRCMLPDGSAGWRLTKNYYTCTRPVDQGPPGPYGTFIFDVTSIGGTEWEITTRSQCPGNIGTGAWGDDLTPPSDEFPAALNFLIQDDCSGCRSSTIPKVYNTCVVTQ